MVGPSGCGKSTLLELVAGLQEPDAGSVEVMGAAGPRRAGTLPRTCPSATCCCHGATRSANAALALECQGVREEGGPPAGGAAVRALRARRVRAHPPAGLSGGMRQRVAFLRTLLAGRPVLLLDEPFGALDSITRSSMQEWLAGALAAEPRTVLLVTHDVEEAILLGDRVAVLSPRPGRVVAELTWGCRARAGAATRSPTPSSSRLVREALDALEGAQRERSARRARRAPVRGVPGRLAGRGHAPLGRRPHARLAGRDARARSATTGRC